MIRTVLSDKVSLSTIIQGFWRLKEWDLSSEKLVDFIKERIDLGVTSFDTAEIYADTYCETLLGETLKLAPELRSQMEIITKTGIFKQDLADGKKFVYYNTGYDRVIQSCKESLQRLNTDYVDLYLIHREDPLIDHHETARALLDLKKQGLIKEFGVSNFDPFKFDALHQATGQQLVTNQIEWNPVCYQHFNSGMMDYLTGKKIAPMIWSPLAGGRLFNPKTSEEKAAMSVIKEIAQKYAVAPDTLIYAWILYHPVGGMPIVGSQNLERIKLAVDALELKLEHYEWFQIYAASGQQEIL